MPKKTAYNNYLKQFHKPVVSKAVKTFVKKTIDKTIEQKRFTANPFDLFSSV